MDFFVKLFRRTKEQPECDVDSVEMASVMSVRLRPQSKARTSIRSHKDDDCYNDKLNRTLKKSTRRKYKRKRRH
ncbi:hypothetical protein RNJ44_00042 [Nakaseomyces bracarensis]|uniref:Uncharacterized protein n=1 Tax=Nakaseomyces bracarensis TaxID=273131 RepID=A0ABR4P0X7_9SACH